MLDLERKLIALRQAYGEGLMGLGKYRNSVIDALVSFTSSYTEESCDEAADILVARILQVR